MPTHAARQAMEILRSTDHFQWYVVPFLLVVLYLYAVEVERRNWSTALAGLALWGMDWFNEIWNGLVFHATNHAPVWGAPGGTAYLILIGLNIEICLMFAMMGIVAVKMLPPDRDLRILGVPNRAVVAVALSIAAVIVELVLHAAHALTWDYWWWSARFPLLIVLIGYLPFFVVAFWVYDMADVRRQVRTVLAILGFDAACLALFVSLGWI